MGWKNCVERTLCIILGELLILMFLNGCAIQQKAEVDIQPIKKETVSVEEQWGIEVEGINLSAAGYMLDFRYKVVDPTKAAHILKRPNESYVIDQSSGRKLLVPRPPKVGSLRQTTLKPEAGRTYFVIFANPGKFVKPGNKIIVAIGDMRIEDLVVN